jgi:hypothetical protein
VNQARQERQGEQDESCVALVDAPPGDEQARALFVSFDAD